MSSSVCALYYLITGVMATPTRSSLVGMTIGHAIFFRYAFVHECVRHYDSLPGVGLTQFRCTRRKSHPPRPRGGPPAARSIAGIFYNIGWPHGTGRATQCPFNFLMDQDGVMATPTRSSLVGNQRRSSEAAGARPRAARGPPKDA